MKLGNFLGGYRTSVKKKLGKKYQKWLELVQVHTSCNEHMADFVRYEIEHGFINFKEGEHPKVSVKKQEATALEEKISLVGMIG